MLHQSTNFLQTQLCHALGFAYITFTVRWSLRQELILELTIIGRLVYHLPKEGYVFVSATVPC